MTRLPSCVALALLSGALVVAWAATPAARLPAAVQAVARTQITAGSLMAPLRFLADDALKGRAVASEGDVLARLYLSAELQALGFQPGGAGGSWYQPLEVIGTTATVPEAWRFAGRQQQIDLRRGEEFVAYSGVQQDATVIENAELVFVGYGIQAPEYQWDDFKNSDLKGKVLLVLNNDPDWDPQLFAGNRRLYYGRWDYKYQSAARLGAAGAIIIHTRASAGYPWEVVQNTWSSEIFDLPAEGGQQLPIKAWATEAAVRRLLRLADVDLDALTAAARARDFQPVSLGIRTSLTLPNRLTRAQTANVIGVLPGSDPRLRDEYVIYSAHHDHLGVGSPDGSGDTIYNGAVDNASGCAQVLAIARALAALPERPRRSIMVVFTAAEEQGAGLLGARFFSRRSAVSPGRMAANINYDGANIWGRTRDVTLIGMGKSSLDEVAGAVAAFQQRRVKDDPFPDRGHFYRADQLAFATIGVPALYFRGGTDFIGRPPDWGRQQQERWEDTQYHQPSDQLTADWNFDGVIEDAQFGFYAGWLIAEADQMPRWRAGDEFEAARLAALKAVAGS